MLLQGTSHYPCVINNKSPKESSTRFSLSKDPEIIKRHRDSSRRDHLKIVQRIQIFLLDHRQIPVLMGTCLYGVWVFAWISNWDDIRRAKVTLRIDRPPITLTTERILIAKGTQKMGESWGYFPQSLAPHHGWQKPMFTFWHWTSWDRPGCDHQWLAGNVNGMEKLVFGPFFDVLAPSVLPHFCISAICQQGLLPPSFQIERCWSTCHLQYLVNRMKCTQ